MNVCESPLSEREAIETKRAIEEIQSRVSHSKPGRHAGQLGALRRFRARSMAPMS